MRVFLSVFILCFAPLASAAPTVWRTGNLLVIYDTEDTFRIEVTITNPDTQGFQGISGKLAWRFLRDISWMRDSFDFVTFFIDTDSGLPYPRGSSEPVYNSVLGSGKPEVDKRYKYQSRRLLAVNGHSTSLVGAPRVSAVLHEVLHQWCCENVSSHSTGGDIRQDLLHDDGTDSDLQHWVRGVDLGVSAMYASAWQEDAEVEGGFRWYPADNKIYHSLEQYLMGLIPASDVLPFRVLLDYGADPAPDRGALRIPERIVPVNITNILNELPERNPDYRNSQRIFHDLFVIWPK